MCFFLLAAAGVFSYPYLSDLLIQNQNRKLLEQWEAALSENRAVQPNAEEANAEQANAPELNAEQAAPISQNRKNVSPLYQEMLAYNRKIYREKQKDLYLFRAWEKAAVDLREYGFSIPVIGSLTIPSIHISYPIYLGASESNLLNGVAHLGETSLPIGTENSNCAICGHCGMMRTEMFRHLDRLKPGDTVLVKNPWETLTYVVTERIIGEPTDHTPLLIQEGKDLLTLVTCYPYPYNSKRLFVQCERSS